MALDSIPGPSGQYTSDAKVASDDTGGWEHFTKTRPFTSCAGGCGCKLAPSQGNYCAVCERIRSMGQMGGSLPPPEPPPSNIG